MDSLSKHGGKWKAKVVSDGVVENCICKGLNTCKKWGIVCQVGSWLCSNSIEHYGSDWRQAFAIYVHFAQVLSEGRPMTD